jgi:hypothetical protein
VEGADVVSLELPSASPFGSPDLTTAPPAVALTRTPSGWAVVSPAGPEHAGELVEGMCLADLVLEELGGSVDPDRHARRSARGAQPAPGPEDPRDARLAALERTVAQLEHALAARVSTERAIGVLAERHGTDPREAFETLRQAARSQGRAVAELAREVLDTLAGRLPSPVTAAADGATALQPATRTPAPRPPVTVDGSCPAATVADGRS